MRNNLVVLGGGITGVGTARLAARLGLEVTLIERADLAAGASSSSSHMLHGGLRYLEQGQFGLVRQALAERSRIMELAPHLARPGRFLVPLYAGQRIGLLRLRAGLALYDMLAGRRQFEPADILGAGAVREMEPGLQSVGLRGAGVYSDGLMEDDALAVAVAADAQRHGAAIRTWREVMSVTPSPGGGVRLGVRDRLGAFPDEEIEADVIVNATGSWVDGVRGFFLPFLLPDAPPVVPRLRPSRGIHLVYPALTRGNGVLFFARSDGRVLFVVPFGQRSLVGTTEAPVGSPPTEMEARPTPGEIRYLRRELDLLMPGTSRVRPLAVTSGVRPLLHSVGDVGDASREHAVLREGPLVTVAGGKYTTFRVMATDAMEAALAVLGRPETTRPADDTEPLPSPCAGSDGLGLAAAAEDGTARRVVDLLRRRTRLWLTDDRGRGAVEEAATLLARRDRWSGERRAAEIAHYLELLDLESALIRRSEEEE